MLKIIAAVAQKGVIGNGPKIPWQGQLPDDMKWFVGHTMYHLVVMGRKTLESIPDAYMPFSGRANVCITRQKGLKSKGVVFRSWEEILELSKHMDIFVLGGGELYALALPHAGELILTRIHESFDGDVYFPDWDPNEWNLVYTEPRFKDEKNKHDFTFEIYHRR